jgi:TolA-binding protein
MTIADELVTYQSLRQRHLDRIEPQLAQLQSHIAQQLQDLQTQEQPLIEAQLAALAVLRPSIEADARCLLTAPTFRERIPVRRPLPIARRRLGTQSRLGHLAHSDSPFSSTDSQS